MMVVVLKGGVPGKKVDGLKHFLSDLLKEQRPKDAFFIFQLCTSILISRLSFLCSRDPARFAVELSRLPCRANSRGAGGL